ncbi:sulfite reductase subunit alpha [Dokdonella sp.]|uniref:sulfite reductase subunit alpha n=1 Tax=Dokdonella sp. TaxID=2291710 RepID=UPI0035276CE5
MTTSRVRRSGNLVATGALTGLAAALIHWQPDTIAAQAPDASRILWAAAAVAVYVLLCALLLRSRHRRNSANITTSPNGRDIGNTETVVVAYASQTGHAEHLATRTTEFLRSGGVDVELCSLRHLDLQRTQAAGRILFVISTTGEGDAPDMAAEFADAVMGSAARLETLRYGVLALGDSEYTNFCAFGRNLDGWLRKAGAQALFDPILVDNGDPGALRHWQYHLGHLAGRSDLPDWQVPDYEPWLLVERRILNPGSAGGPCFHIVLEPASAELPHWQAGDIAEIGPQQASADVESWLVRHRLDGAARILVNGREESLREVAARSSLDAPTSSDPQQVAESLQRLPHRDYSIASIPADGHIELLLRQWRRSDGSLGLGTGWLTEHAKLGTEIGIRIRANSGFHAPNDDRPLLLIGNGTGMASLRALLRQRALEKRHRNWLIFGERNASIDFHFREEILAWAEQGVLERMDLAFSRDQSERVYVQHRLEAAASELGGWIANGAEILVCGSLEGMAPAVDDTLTHILGSTLVRELIASGRYRRDVY